MRDPPMLFGIPFCVGPTRIRILKKILTVDSPLVRKSIISLLWGLLWSETRHFPHCRVSSSKDIDDFLTAEMPPVRILMISSLGPACGTLDDPQPIEALQNSYADIMRDSMGIMNSGEAIVCAQAQVDFFSLCGICAKWLGTLPPAQDNTQKISKWPRT